MGARLGGPQPVRPEPAQGWKAPAWFGACLLLGCAYPFVALLNPPWTYGLLGGPLLIAGMLTRPLNPALRLLGFFAFLLGAFVAGVLAA
jgi:hypothetical protein